MNQIDLYYEIIDKFNEISSDNDSSNNNGGIGNTRMSNTN